MQVIGLCRFSYPGIGGYQVEHATLQERIAFLYAPDRLEARFRTFEAFTLPCMRAQSDDDFTFLIVIGETLPAPWRQRLEALVADMPQARIMPRPPGRHRVVMQEAINTVRNAKGPCLQFRMDDDDAVAVSYVEKLRAAAGDIKSLLSRNRHVAIDFSNGYIARPGPAGIAAAPTNVPFTTAGLGLLIGDGVPLSVMNFAHARIGRRMPALCLPDEDMMVRGHTGMNDSRQKPGVKPVKLSPLDSAGEARFRTAFNIDAKNIRRIFSPPG